MEAKGKWAVIAVAVVAISMSTFGWWWNLQRGKRSLEFWSPQTAFEIRQGKVVTAFRLAGDQSAETLLTDRPAWHIEEQKDVSTVAGLIHARNSLLDDASFLWDAPPPTDVRWTHSLWFEGAPNEKPHRAQVLFDLDHGYMANLRTGKILRLNDHSHDAWRIAFGDRYFKQPELLPKPAATK